MLNYSSELRKLSEESGSRLESIVTMIEGIWWEMVGISIIRVKASNRCWTGNSDIKQKEVD